MCGGGGQGCGSAKHRNNVKDYCCYRFFSCSERERARERESVCVRACVHACVRACVRVCVCDIILWLVGCRMFECCSHLQYYCNLVLFLFLQS